MIRESDFLKDVLIPATLKWPKVSLIVPACNEEATIGPAARSLLAMDYPHLELILVNDRSTDGTGEIVARLAVQDSRIQSITVDALPEGWLGKVHALAQGVERATGEWLLFSDADVHYGPQSLKKAMMYSEARGFDFLTVVPDVVSRTFPLKIFMVHVFHTFGLAFSKSGLADPNRPDAFGSGVFNLVRRSAYDRSEGFEALKLEVLDDGGLAWLLKSSGAKLGSVNGHKELCLEWYANLRGFIRGIEKNSFTLFQYSLTFATAYCLGVWMLFAATMVIPLFATGVLFAAYLVALAFYLGCSALSFWYLSDMSGGMALTLPISFFLVPFLILRSTTLCLWRGGIQWRGTFYSLEALRSNQRLKIVGNGFRSLALSLKII